ncbi:MAG: transporter [Verrucomicrobiota bacterium]
MSAFSHYAFMSIGRLIPISVVFVAITVVCSPIHAQDLEPRAYSNSPTGLSFAIGSYTFSKGSVPTDPALPIDNSSIETHTAVFALATTLNVFGKSAKLDMIVPYTSLAAQGVVAGVYRERLVTDFGDPFLRFSINFYGAPALTMKEFASYKQDWIIGASLRVGVPLGHYDEDKLINLGSNRWSFRPEVGVSKAFGRWTVELAPGVAFYTDNGDFFGGKTRKQAPLFGVQSSVTYSVLPGLWLSFSGSYFAGGRTTVDGIENDNKQEGGRIGATLSLPVNRQHAVKLYAFRGFNADREADLDGVGIAWQYRWGGGF